MMTIGIPDVYESRRQRMVDEQIERRGIHNPRLIQALRRVPRHCFVPTGREEEAYDDRPLAIGSGQTISQPYIVALMTDLLELQGNENVLEVGTGSGYQAAILAMLARQIYSIEYRLELAERSRNNLKSIGVTNVEVICGDGTIGLEKYAPYQGILVTAAAPEAPPPLFEQLADGGRLVIPVGNHWGQELLIWRRQGESYELQHSIPVVFVPLRGAYGWGEGDWM